MKKEKSQKTEAANRKQTEPVAGGERSPKLIDSPQLFGNRQEIMIRHNGELYRIRITRNGKLIMNK